ncbi:MAG: hypothetical protein M9905_00975 [Rhizobiaceae bacterium]|nr:hypothetical protein [Rhizobiaceae bacterium]
MDRASSSADTISVGESAPSAAGTAVVRKLTDRLRAFPPGRRSVLDMQGTVSAAGIGSVIEVSVMNAGHDNGRTARAVQVLTKAREMRHG